MRRTSWTPLTIGITTALLLIAGSPTGWVGTPGDCPYWDEDCRAAERETILQLVRQHRRADSTEWHETLADVIYDEAVNADVDPLLVASIVAKESSFRTRVVSHKGAVGLMQLRPFVARDLSRRVDLPWSGVETLHSPELNLRLGILYYKEMMDRFDGDTHKALTAYNFGPTRVSRQLRDGTYRDSRYSREILDLYSRLRETPVRATERT